MFVSWLFKLSACNKYYTKIILSPRIAGCHTKAIGAWPRAFDPGALLPIPIIPLTPKDGEWRILCRIAAYALEAFNREAGL
jgi:hypothetical protein